MSTTPEPDLDPFALAAVADEADEAAALPSPYDGDDVEQEDGSPVPDPEAA